MVGVEKYRHAAEMVFRLNGHVIQGKSSTTEMYGSVDQLVDKILRQVRKRKSSWWITRRATTRVVQKLVWRSCRGL